MKRFFFLLILTLALAPTSYADKVYFLVTNDDAMQARIDLIQQAEKELLVEYFSVWNDTQSLAGIGLLIQAAKRGVKVKVIYDALSIKVPKSLLAGMVSQGVDENGNHNLELRAYNRFNIFTIQKRTHAKMILADGKRIISGGRNVGDKYFGKSKGRNYDDMDIMVESPVVQEVRNNFMTLWNTEIVSSPYYYQYDFEKLTDGYCGTKDDYHTCERERMTALQTIKKEIERVKRVMGELAAAYISKDVINFSGKDWMAEATEVSNIEYLANNPDSLNSKKQRHMADRLLQVLAGTKASVEIVSPYLIPTERLLVGLQAALDRGVKIKILTNSLLSTDNFLEQAGYRKYREQLIGMGIEIHEYTGPDTLHAKAGLIDGHIFIVGTFNIDPRSANLNREMGFMFTEPVGNSPGSDELKTHIDHFQTKSRLVGKDKQSFVIANEERDLSGWKRATLQAATFLLPFIEKYL